MKTTLLAALALGLFAPATEFTFAPEEGTSLTKSFTSEVSMELVEMKMVAIVDGEEVERNLDDVPEVTIAQATEVEFVDKYEAMGSSRPNHLVRTFKTLGLTFSESGPSEDGESESEKAGESELAGATVAFLWQEDEEAYKVKYVAGDDDDNERDEALLEGFEIDADYRALLPKKEVEVDDSWELEADVFYLVTNPGGDLHIDLDDEDEEDGEEDFDGIFRENLAGEWEATLTKIDEGKAHIALAGDLSTSVPREMDLGDDAPDGLEVTRTMGFEYGLEGMLVWDLEANRAVSFEVKGEIQMSIIFEQSGGDMPEITRTQVFEGEFKDTGAIQAAE